jgi:hypothetical protein
MTLDQIIRELKVMSPRARDLAPSSFVGRAWSLPQEWSARICEELGRALADGKALEHIK